MVKTDVIPNYYVPLTHWVAALFVIYTVLTLSGMIAYGGALLLTRLLPHWLGWVIIVYNLAGLVILGVTADLPPFLHHLLPIVMGILLLLPRYQMTAKNQQKEEIAYGTMR